MKKIFIISGLILSGLSASVIPYPSVAFAKSSKTAEQNRLYHKFMKVLTSERNQYSRARAATELGIIGDARALTQLHKSLIGDVSPQVRITSAYAIARINKKSSARPLLMALAKQKGIKQGRIDVQLAIIQAVGDMGENGRGQVVNLKRLLRSPSGFVREAAVESLWKIRDYSVSNALIYLLAHESELIVKLTLTKYIADFKDARAIPVLERLMNDSKEHIDVKAMAQDAIEKLENMAAHGQLRMVGKKEKPSKQK